ncbi:hypothetical protein FOL47_002922 [Perkinsus chesapeaki]|uniref:Uncharacterized protein n=1 Tax=Perkinsus chesapeaki TaxID=330153 RepID=A0A7J6MAN0_PERCH|nr:hypothetical protein FOL47_002922 [Perkinsus chesapeaki]
MSMTGTESVDSNGLGSVVVLDLPFESNYDKEHQQEASSLQPLSPLCASAASTTTSVTDENPSLSAIGMDSIEPAVDSLTRILSSDFSNMDAPPAKRARGVEDSFCGDMQGHLAFPVLTGVSEPHVSWNPSVACGQGLYDQPITTPSVGPMETQQPGLAALLEELARPIRSPEAENVHNMVTMNSTRKKDYSAPPGVWKNSGGYISTVYINKRRIYGPLRQTLEESVRDREQMLLAKERGATEEEIRELVVTMKRLHPSPAPVRRPNSKRARSDSAKSTGAAANEFGMGDLLSGCLGGDSRFRLPTVDESEYLTSTFA